jgi:hypothetical protein
MLPVGNAHLAIVTTADDLVDAPSGTLAVLAADPGPDGFVSLREAILAANLTLNEGGPDRIEFAIPGVGPHSIPVADPGLPEIVDPVNIDAFTQPSGPHEIVLDGSAVVSAAGLRLGPLSDGSSVRGLVITGFGGAGVYAINSGAHTIESCLIGVEADGETPDGNDIGIQLHNSPSNTIGGSLSAVPRESNVVSGNVDQGVMVTGDASTDNLILGNIIGLNFDGDSAVGNGSIGVEIKDHADGNTVGSTSLDSRNVISANGTHGVRINGRSGGAHDNVIIGNFIGSDIAYSGNATLGNDQSGVRILRDAQRTIVGGDNPGEGNRIAFNGASGVRIGEGATLPGLAAVLGNWISMNGELGIELFDDDPDFVTLNDPGDVDGGTNGTQNFPELTTLSFAADDVTVDFTLDTLAGDYRIEFFSSAAADDICAVNPAMPPACLDGPGGLHYHGEGAVFRHAVDVSVAGTGPEAFQTSFAGIEEHVISATATPIVSPDVYGGTSEFSRAVPTTFP